MRDYDTYSIPYTPPRTRRFLPVNLKFKSPQINYILFGLTFFSTWLTAGLWYSVPVLAILLSHEMGHYLMCRRYRVPATLPYFIPFPFLNPFGTMGAMIKMRGFIPSRKALFDIGAGGPLAGLVVTLPVLYFGIAQSEVTTSLPADTVTFILGESLLYKAMSFLALGPLPENADVLMHPMAYAGWVGLFVTALNLLPIGQLDGGHVFYSMFGAKARRITWAFIAALGILSIVYPGWILLFVLLLFLGRSHPAPLDDYTPLDAKRRLLGYVIFLIFVLSFTPMPFVF